MKMIVANTQTDCPSTNDELKHRKSNKLFPNYKALFCILTEENGISIKRIRQQDNQMILV